MRLAGKPPTLLLCVINPVLKERKRNSRLPLPNTPTHTNAYIQTASCTSPPRRSHMSSCDLRTTSRTRFLKAALSLRHMTAASTLAGLSSLGSESMEMTDTMIDSTPKMGRQRSMAVSSGLCASSPGGCRMEMHTLPSS